MMGLDRVFNARSVAVVGASKDEKKRGYQAIKALLDGRYEGDIYPVHPSEERVLGLKCYPRLSDIDGPVDLALITTPAHTIPGIIEECGKKKVAGAVIIAGGFGELGGEGKKLQTRIVRIAREAGVRMVGPNTSGMISVHNNMNLVGLSDIPRGDIALISQSGNMALALITEARIKSQKGFSYYFGVGNEADLKFHEYLEFLTADDKTRAIVMYVEGMTDGRKFLQQAYETTAKKPIVLLKSGRSIKGAKSAGSHTGALAGISEVARTAFRRAGITVVENSDELFPVTEALASLPPLRNNKVAILADGGGHATIAADILTEYGVEIPRLKKRTREKLAEVLSPNASLVNPIDVAGSTDSDPSVFAECARILLDDEQIGGLLLVGLFGGYGIRFADRLKFMEEDAAHQLGKLVKRTGKPVVVHSLYNFARPHSLDLLRYYSVPVHDSIDIACKCFSALGEYGQFLDSRHKRHNFVFNWGHKANDEAKEIIEGAYADGRSSLLEHEAKRVLRLHDAPVSDDRLATSGEKAARLGYDIDRPVAMKIVSPDILHKSEAGGVKLGITSPKEAREAYKLIIKNARKYKPNADIRGCLISPMAESGVDVIIGTKIDQQFGPVIMFGIGGIFVEVLKDVVFRVLPLSREAARRMISEIRSAPIFNGFRGKPPIDQNAIVELLMIVSEIIEAYPEICEIDLNPVIVRQQGLSIVDARIILKESRPG
ncbi:MAG: acetate--CoA ligase family protein [Proteobacteria bacterium]|jgi:acetyltransferase|nr:acetate--CoA ligase family protein [Pseudomonadota bacterium]